jgi:hypothetical protein
VKKLVPFIAAAAVLGAWPAASSAASFSGVVVARQGGVTLVAARSGAVHAFHARARVGDRVVARGSGLAVVGRARTAHIRGIVVRRSGGRVFITAAHRILMVHTGSRRLAAAADAAPQPGAVVSTTVSVNPTGELDEENEQEVGEAQNAQVQATISAVGQGTVTLTVNGQTLTIPLPAGLTLPASVVGQTVTLNLSFSNGQVTAEDNDDQGDDDQGDDDSGGGDNGD